MIELNKIYNENCLDTMARMPEGFVDLIITDPPYGLNYRSNWGSKTGNLKDYIANDKLDDWLKALPMWLNEFERITKENSEWYIFCGGGGEPIIAYMWLELKKLKKAKVKNLLIWDKEFVGMGWDWRFQYETIFQIQKGNGLDNSMNGTTRGNVLRCKNVIPQAGQHPTEKPISLIEQILLAKPSGRLVYDGFCGSGSTVKACIKQKREWIASEIEAGYCKLANDGIALYRNQITIF